MVSLQCKLSTSVGQQKFAEQSKCGFSVQLASRPPLAAGLPLPPNFKPLSALPRWLAASFTALSILESSSAVGSFVKPDLKHTALPQRYLIPVDHQRCSSLADPQRRRCLCGGPGWLSIPAARRRRSHPTCGRSRSASSSISWTCWRGRRWYWTAWGPPPRQPLL